MDKELASNLSEWFFMGGKMSGALSHPELGPLIEAGVKVDPRTRAYITHLRDQLTVLLQSTEQDPA